MHLCHFAQPAPHATILGAILHSACHAVMLLVLVALELGALLGRGIVLTQTLTFQTVGCMGVLTLLKPLIQRQCLRQRNRRPKLKTWT